MSARNVASAIAVCLLLCTGFTAVARAQEGGQALTNADVVKMVEGGLPESVVVSAIQSSPGKYDISPDGLIALHKAGVTQHEMDAIMASAKSTSATTHSAIASSAASGETTAPIASSSKSRIPKVLVLQGASSKELPLEKTQLAETKSKPSSMTGLAGDSAVSQGMQAGVNTAAWDTAVRTNSAVGGSAVEGAGSVFSGILSHRSPTVTYVWGVPNPASTNILHGSKPSFSVDFSQTPGVDPDDYEPTIVKLTPSHNSCRIVGASQGKQDARSSAAADWQIYSHFLEERVATTPEKLGAGKYKVSPAAELLPGEYGLVLRPVSKTKKFSGGDVARGQGDGLMFDAVWTFQIPQDAE